MAPILRVGIGGPIGSGKTALMEQLCRRFRGNFELPAITSSRAPRLPKLFP